MNKEYFISEILPLKDKLFRFANSILNDEDLAQDVVQETFEKVWNKRKEMHTIKNIEAWCMTVTRNSALVKYRLKDNQNSRLDVVTDAVELSQTPYQKTEMADVIKKIEFILAGLPVKLRELFQLRDIEEYSYNEICDITGYKLSDVKVSVLRARKTIKENLQNVYAYEKYG